MKKFLPFIIGGLGAFMIGFSVILRNGTPDADVVITNLVSTFMLVAGVICVLVGLVTFFLRHDEQIW
ncbi:MAG: hypothetical protein K2X81_05005 [Candidatus Obscuribacterales bacterium]|nr:hypothetical protein [Candidatus Obscuribacterales bacterium]